MNKELPMSAETLRNLSAAVDNGTFAADAVPADGKIAAEASAPTGEATSSQAPPKEEAAKDSKPTIETKAAPEATKPVGTEAKPSDGKPADGKPRDAKSSYQKAGDSDEEIKRGYDDLKSQRAAFEEEKRKFEETKQQPPQQTQQPPNGSGNGNQPRPQLGQDGQLRDHHGRSARDYREAAKDWASSDDPAERALAVKALDFAQGMENQEGQLRYEHQMQTHKSAWISDMQARLKEIPELDDTNSALSKKVVEVMQSNPVFYHTKDGFSQAVRYAKAEIGGARAADLEARLAKAEKDLQDARLKIMPANGSVTTQPSAGAAKKAPTAAEVRRMAMEADFQGGIHGNFQSNN